MKQLSRLETVNLVGIILAISAFTFGPWLGSHSAIWVINDLRQFLSSANAATDVSRQETIYYFLTTLMFLLLAMPFFWNKKRNASRRLWIFLQFACGLMAILLLSFLMVVFDAQTSGVYWTFFGSVIASGTAVIEIFKSTSSSQTLIAPAEITVAEQPQLTKVEEQANCVEKDEMAEFQKQLADSFRHCRDAKRPFSLTIIGIAYHDSYATIFGEEAAQDMTDMLAEYTRQTMSGVLATSFSVGAVMAAFPEIETDMIKKHMKTIETRMQDHGFPGEMLLPDGHIRLFNAMVSTPDDGVKLSELNQKVLQNYSDLVVQLI